MKHWLYIFLALSILISQSCDEDSFSQIVEVELPDHDPMVVVSSHLYNGLNSWAILGLSRQIAHSPAKNLQNAQVTIFQNDIPVDTLVYTEEEYKGGGLNFNSGDLVVLQVTLNNQTYRSTQTIKAIPNVGSVKFDPLGATGMFGEKMDETQVEIIDPGGEENFYMIEVLDAQWFGVPEYPDSTFMDTVRRYVESLDPIIHGDFLAIFSDNTFDGTTYRVLLQSYPNGIESDNYVRVSSINRDYYYYLRAKMQYDASRDNPFAEPVVIPSNIENGLGFFSIVNSVVLKAE